MLDLGFIHALRRIVEAAAAQAPDAAVLGDDAARRSPSWPRDYLDDPVKVAVAPAATTAERVEQGVMFVPTRATSATCWRRCCAIRASSACWSSPAPSTAPTGSRGIWSQPASRPPRSTATSRSRSASARSPVFARPRPRARRHRHRRPRHRRGKRLACHQFRAAERAGGLCAPDRPNRARRRRRESRSRSAAMTRGLSAQHRKADRVISTSDPDAIGAAHRRWRRHQASGDKREREPWRHRRGPKKVPAAGRHEERRRRPVRRCVAIAGRPASPAVGPERCRGARVRPT